MNPWGIWAIWLLCCRLLVNVEVGGDLSLGRGFTERMRTFPGAAEAYFRPLREHLRGVDLSLANLEGCVRDRPGQPPIGVRYDLSFGPNTARALGQTGFSALGLANNHAGDASGEGFDATLNILHDLGIRPVAGIERFDLHGTLVTVVALDYCRGRRLSLVNPEMGCTPAESHGCDAICGNSDRSHRWKIDITSPKLRSRWVDRVRSLEREGPVIVFLHGGAEDCDEVSPDEITFFQELRAVGAAGVFGHHPHRIKLWSAPRSVFGTEASPLFISLGSVLFDRSRSPDCYGLLVRLTFWAGIHVRTTLFPVHISGRTYRPVVWPPWPFEIFLRSGEKKSSLLWSFTLFLMGFGK
ncbi:MAG: CapA family protein [Candidatus Ozemobacteraceae bacterium]